MGRIGDFPLRRIAENELAEHLGARDAADRDDLATSLVRQWLTNGGHAGLVTPARQLWFRLAAHAGGRLEVGVGGGGGDWGRILTRDWHVDAEDVPGPPAQPARLSTAPRGGRR